MVLFYTRWADKVVYLAGKFEETIVAINDLHASQMRDKCRKWHRRDSLRVSSDKNLMISVPFFSSSIFGDVDFEISYIIENQLFRRN